MPKGDQKDMMINLERDNNSRKEKLNYLKEEIKLMKTKLSRV